MGKLEQRAASTASPWVYADEAAAAAAAETEEDAMESLVRRLPAALRWASSLPSDAQASALKRGIESACAMNVGRSDAEQRTECVRLAQEALLAETCQARAHRRSS